MNDLTITETNLPVAAADIFSTDNLSDLTEGTSGGFGVMSIRGSRWRIKSGGEETVVTGPDGDPVASVPVVLVKASAAVSKLFYEKNYEEGDDNPPDCFSLDGESPDPTASNPQAGRCATCPQNQWGSRITDSGTKAKNCSDIRRVAVVPAARKPEEADANILANEQYGGPMLLRIPPASLKDMVKFSNLLKSKYGKNYNAIVTLIGFDTQVSYPKLTFKAVRHLTEEEKAKVVEFYGDGSLNQILQSAPEMATTQPKPKAETTVDADMEDDRDPAEVTKKAAAAKPAAKKKAAKKAQPKKAAVEEEPAQEDEMEVMRRKLAEMEAAAAATKTDPADAAKGNGAAGQEVPTELAEGIESIVGELDNLDALGG